MYLVIFQVLLPFWFSLTCATITNRTIDDTHGDLITGEQPTYLPGPWQNPDCDGCGIRPSQDNAFMQTYSAITWNDFTTTYVGATSVSITLNFHGTAIYVYFILANLVKGLDPKTHTGTLSDFTLDGNYISSFHHIPTSSSDFDFNALVFSKGNLSNEKHTLSISTSGVDERFWICFDYAHYTFDDALESPTTTPTPHTVPVGAIVGGAVGGASVLGIIIITIFYLYRRRHMSSPVGDTSSTGGLQPFLLTQDTLDDMRDSRTAAPNHSQLTSKFPSVYNATTLPSDETNSISIASTRQAEIDRQIRELTREVQALAGVKTTSPKRSLYTGPSLASERSHEERAPTDQIQQQMDTIKREIEYLQVQLHSDWARGLTNDPPPSYRAL